MSALAQASKALGGGGSVNWAFVFPGQGVEFIGMGEDYCKRFAIARTLFGVASERMGLDLRVIMAKGPARTLAQAEIAQPVVFTMNLVIASLLAERGINPSLAAGHSLGQFAAVTVAGAMDFSSALDLVIARGQYLQECNTQANGGMMAVDMLSRDVIEATIAEFNTELWISNFNAPSQCVVSGRKPALWQLKKALDRLGGNCRWLNVPGPAHSPLMKPAADKLSAKIDTLPLRDPRIAVLASASGLPLADAAAIRAELHRHMLMPVNWVAVLRRLLECGTRLIQVGPGRVLKGLALRNDWRSPCLITSTLSDFEESLSTIEEAATCAL
jgi:[acyl-carrier-protein] S-malonyltransferase